MFRLEFSSTLFFRSAKLLRLILPSVTVTLFWGSVTEENYEPTDIMPSGSRMSSTAGASTSLSCPSERNKDHFLVIPVVHSFSNWRLSNTFVRHMCITCLIRRVLLDRFSMVRMNCSQQKLLHWQSLNNHTSYIYIYLYWFCMTMMLQNH